MSEKAPMPPWWVERVDREDGYFAYEIWGGSRRDCTDAIVMIISEHNWCNAKELADLICQRTKHEGLREALVRIEIITASGRTTELLAKMAQVNALARAALFSGRDGRKCPSMMLAPGSFSGGPQVPCTGIKTAEGVTGGCGEPCSFVMERS